MALLLRRARMPVLLLILFVVAWLPRILALDAYVSVDERKWLDRSANFYWSLAHGDLAGTFQKEHPGVTVMWAGTLGFLQELPEYVRKVSGQLTDDQLETWLHQSTAHSPLEMLVAGRRFVVLAIVVSLVACFFPLRRLFGGWIAALAVLAIAWDPFQIGLSRQLHPDGLLAALTCLALLSFLAWLYAGRTWRYLILSGIALGLALLTKVPAAVILPVGALLVAMEWLQQWRAGKRVPYALLFEFVLWAALASAVFVALWPALWQQPIPVLVRMAGQMRGYILEGHSLPNYFLGEATSDPGLMFYPMAWLFRTTPFSLLGLLAALVWAVRSRWPLDHPTARRTVWALLIFSLVFSLLATSGAKKFDRYLLPVFVVLDVVAVLGWLGAAKAILSRWGPGRVSATVAAGSDERGAAPAVFAMALALVFAIHGLPGFITYPYYLTFFNPMAGGAWLAPKVLFVGWGEGLNEAAAWLNKQPNADKLRIVSWYGDGPLSYYLRSQEDILDFQQPNFWFDADYAVFYVNQWQRKNPDAEMIDYFAAQPAAYVVRAGGLELARVYDLHKNVPPQFTQLYTDSAADFGQGIRLAAYHIKRKTALPGDSLKLTLFLKALAPIATDYRARLQLIGTGGTVVWEEERSPAGMDTSQWPVKEVRQDIYKVEFAPDLPPGDYQVRFSLLEPTTGQTLAIAPAADGGQPDDPGELTVLSVRVEAPEQIPVDAQWDPVQLTALQHAPSMKPGDTLLVELGAEGQVDGSLKLSLRLVDESGTTMALVDKALKPQLRWALTLPTDAAPGNYQLAAVLYDPNTLAALPDAEGNVQQILSTVAVQP